MGSLISNTELTSQLEEVIPGCSKLNVISAFVTMPAISWLSNLTANSNPKVNLVGRFIPKDFIDGASSIDAIRQCLDSGYKVKAISNLHAKIYQIDDDLIFTGSANMTGKGLALVVNDNLEACAKIAPTDDSKNFIQRIINISIDINLEVLDKMELFIENLSPADSISIPTTWPEDIIPKIKDVFVSDFPLSKPGAVHGTYDINPSLEFAVIESNAGDFNVSQNLFKNSKAYCWLKAVLIEHKGERDLGFGKISSLLHDALSDDPTPYRRDIKTLQANLYDYIQFYASDEIEVYVPGRRSQVLKLLD